MLMIEVVLRRLPSIGTALALAAATLLPVDAFAEGRGILLLAHGGSAEWNARVMDLAQQVDARQPVEVAFGMATRRTIQSAVDRLAARSVTEIVAVPLFVSSWSSVITSTEYLLGLRSEPPAALALFAKMDHGEPAPADAGHAGHSEHATQLGSTPVSSSVPIRGMTPALNRHTFVAQILSTRARAISSNPEAEAVIVVAHGPVSDDEDRQWLADMRVLTDMMGSSDSFASIDALTLRDDAPAPVRAAATASLRRLVQARLSEGRKVLIVPLLLSFGGIERGLAERLAGLAYTMPNAALMPDARLVEWVIEMAKP